MKTDAVILNYNDSAGSIDAAERIECFACIDHIIIVDNASGSGELDRLEDFIHRKSTGPEASRYVLIHSPVNTGYGTGNDMGITYALEHFDSGHALVMNPDSVFSEELVLRMLEAFSDDTAAIVGAVMEGRALQDSAWPFRGLWGEAANSGPVLRRLFRKRINYSEDFFAEGRKAGQTEVYAVHGSLVMFDTEKYRQMGGFDRDIFLYEEENVIAFRSEKHGFRTFLIQEPPYSHAGSASTKKAGLGAVRRERERQRSEQVYYKKYLGMSGLQTVLITGLQKLVLLETAVAAKMGVI